MVKMHMIILQFKEQTKAHDQIAFYTFHSFLMEVQTNAGYICVKQARVIEPWRSGLRACLVTISVFQFIIKLIGQQ